MNGEKFYDTGKVKIGLTFQRDTRPQLSRFEESLQEAILSKKSDPLNAFIARHPAIATVLFIAGIALICGLFDTI